MKPGILPAIAGAMALALSNLAHADITSDLKAQVDALQRQLEAVKAQLDQVQREQQEQRQKQSAPQPQGQPQGGPFIQRKPGDALTFIVPGGGEVTLYGSLDVSLDETTKGLKSDYGDNGGMPVGKLRWRPAIAPHLSYMGVRAEQPI